MPDTKPCKCGCGEYLTRKPKERPSKWNGRQFLNCSHAASHIHKIGNHKNNSIKVTWNGKLHTLKELYEKYGRPQNIGYGAFKSRYKKYGIETAITGKLLGTQPNAKKSSGFGKGQGRQDPDDEPRGENLSKIPVATEYDKKFSGRDTKETTLCEATGVLNKI